MFTVEPFGEQTGWTDEEGGGKTLHLLGLVPEQVEPRSELVFAV